MKCVIPYIVIEFIRVTDFNRIFNEDGIYVSTVSLHYERAIKNFTLDLLLIILQYKNKFTLEFELEE